MDYFEDDVYSLSLINELMDKVVEGFLKGKPDVKRRMGDIMGGKVLRTKTDEIFEDGIAKGKEQGLEQGRASAFAELVAEGLLSIADAAKKLNISEEMFKKTYML